MPLEEGEKASAACCFDAPEAGEAVPADACPGRGSDEVCGASWVTKGGDAKRGWGKAVTFAQAEQICKNWGYRLCTMEEVQDGELSGIAPYQDQWSPYAWTSTVADKCGNGRVPPYECLPCDEEKPQGRSCCIFMDAVTER